MVYLGQNKNNTNSRGTTSIEPLFCTLKRVQPHLREDVASLICCVHVQCIYDVESVLRRAGISESIVGINLTYKFKHDDTQMLCSHIDVHKLSNLRLQYFTYWADVLHILCLQALS